MHNSKNILILCSDNYDKQPRVIRTIKALEESYKISVAGISTRKEHTINFIDLSDNLKKNKIITYKHFNKPFYLRLPVSFYYKYIKQKQYSKSLFFERQYWTESRKADLEQLKRVEYNLLISHGTDTLPLAIKLSEGKIPVIFNAHEYYPLEFEQDKTWLKTEGIKINYILKKYLPQCSLMFCVSANIEKEYLKIYKIKSIVITNATAYADLKINATQKPIKIIHHGAAMRSRQIELMAEIMEYLNDNYILYFMLIPTEKVYLEELKQKYRFNKKIKFIEPVNVSQISKECNKYDIGLFILPPVNFNWLNALPNKLFEYIQGRLAIAVSPNPDMKLLVENYNLGVVSKDYSSESMAMQIKSFTLESINAFKLNSHKHATELSSESNQKKILEVVNQLILK